MLDWSVTALELVLLLLAFLALPRLAAWLLALRPLSGKGILEIVASNVVIAAVAIAISADHTHSRW